MEQHAGGWGGADTIAHCAAFKQHPHASNGRERVAGESSTMEERNVCPVSQCPELRDTRLVGYRGLHKEVGGGCEYVEWESVTLAHLHYCDTCVLQSCDIPRVQTSGKRTICRKKHFLLQSLSNTCLCLAMRPAAPCPHLPHADVEGPLDF